jgi:hypothetical protein
MDTRKAVAGLRRFVKRLVADGATNRDAYREWKQDSKNEAFMARCLGYVRGEGMASVTSLVQPFFHPELPLIGLNYTNTAHVTLHHFGDAGWTPGVRLCRGIVFDQTGRVVAFPFPKFFNYGEHLETSSLPGESFVATKKQDGHLGIVFEYGGSFHITTRGSFLSNTSLIATEMLAAFQARWKKALPKSVCPLVEIIHPETEVLTDYQGWTGFILIGAFNRRTYQDFDYTELQALAGRLGIEVTPRWEGNSIADLIELMKDLSVENEEGFVARFAGGLRVKFKFASYIGRMIGEKLNVRYVMRRLMDGTLEKRVGDLPGEVQGEADRIKALVLGVKDVTGSRKDRWAYLYALETDAEQCNDTYKALCRSFQAWLVRTGQLSAVK